MGGRGLTGVTGGVRGMGDGTNLQFKRAGPFGQSTLPGCVQA